MGLVIFSLLAMLSVLWYFKSVAQYFLLALVMFYLTMPIVSLLERRGFSKGKALSLTVVCFLILIAGVVKVVFPAVVMEIDDFNDKLPLIEEKIGKDFLRDVYDTEGNRIGYYSPLLDIEFGADKIEAIFGSFFDKLKGFIASALTLILSAFVIVPILLYIFVKEGDAMKKKFFHLIPNKYFEVTHSMVFEINKSIESFIGAKLIESFIIAVIASVGFFLVGLKLPFVLGILVGLFNIIPYLGPFIGAIPPLAISYLFADHRTVLLTFSVIIFAQLIDNIILQPFLIPRLIKEHPLTVILVTLVGAQLMGPVGMIIAIPAFTIIKTVLAKSYHALDVVYPSEVYDPK